MSNEFDEMKEAAGLGLFGCVVALAILALAGIAIAIVIGIPTAAVIWIIEAFQN